jgi:hypothetical protein
MLVRFWDPTEKYMPVPIKEEIKITSKQPNKQKHVNIFKNQRQ